MSALDAAQSFVTAMYRESDALHADPKRWPQATATALLQAKVYADRVRRFLVAGHPVEARKAFEAMDAERLRPLLDGNADLRLAFDALAAFFDGRSL